MSDALDLPATNTAFKHHPRAWQNFAYAYPVVSRRSHGLSIGINLQPSGACNFDCIYCCVDRSGGTKPDRIDLDHLQRELDQLLSLAASGEIWKDPRFHDVEPDYRHLNDIAFSGNGEPTVSPAFPEAVDIAIESRRRAGYDTPPHRAKLVLITNATRLDKPRVVEAIDKMTEAGGFEPWVKLDAGTSQYYQAINQSPVPFDDVLSSIQSFGWRRPMVIQTMLCQLNGQAMPDEEFEAYIARLDDFQKAGCRILAVHLYTVARQTASPTVSACSVDELDAFARRLRERLPTIRVQTFPSPG